MTASDCGTEEVEMTRRVARLGRATALSTRSLAVGLLFLLVGVPSPSVGASREVLAEVDGAPITNEEIEAALAASLRGLEAQRYDLKRQKLDALVNERLLAREAARRGMTTQALLDVEVIAKATTVTEQDVETFYTANKKSLKGSEAELKGLMRAHLQNQRLGERRKAFLESLRSQAEVVVHLKEPPGLRIVVSTDGAPSVGASDAPVTIVEFSDFQCLYCKQVLPTLVQLRSRYGDKVKLVFRDFPRASVHPLARRAAEAARCANDQGKFWEYHDILFANAPKAMPEQLKEYAQKAGLDVPKFEQCLSTGTHAAAVQKDLDDGIRLGVTDAPAFFINGRFLSVALPLESFVRVIDAELGRAR